MSTMECHYYSSWHFWLIRLLKFDGVQHIHTQTHTYSYSSVSSCICTQICPLYGHFIYLLGLPYILMTVIRLSNFIEKSTLCLSSASDGPEKCFTQNQISWHYSIEPHQLNFSVLRYELAWMLNSSWKSSPVFSGATEGGSLSSLSNYCPRRWQLMPRERMRSLWFPIWPFGPAQSVPLRGNRISDWSILRYFIF